MSETVELLFFDTFAHDNTEELNLDLVQFPKPVFVTEVRIIPLGARVQSDFPGGVRLGATNPSQFQIEFFVNDLGKPGASTFESLGGFEYNQNGCINLNCTPEETARKIPTDGLVLRGWYTTITLAVYGTLTNNITEQIIQAVVNPALPAQANTIADAQQIVPGSTIENEWSQENVPMEYNPTATAYPQNYSQPENYSQEYTEYYNDVPKDPRSYHHSEGDWDPKVRPRTSESDRERDRNRDSGYQKTGSIERDRDKPYPRSRSRDRSSRDYSRDPSREREWEHRDRDWDRTSRYKHDENYRRSYGRDERDDRKRPRTPQSSPKRPHTPHERKEGTSPPPEPDSFSEEEIDKNKSNPTTEIKEEVVENKSPTKEEDVATTTMDQEEFEPILSDEDIVDEDMEYDYSGYVNNDDLIKLFVAGVTNLRRFERKKCFAFGETGLKIEENLKTTIGIVDDYFKSSITKYVIGEFPRLNTEIKEEFIHLCEKLIVTFNDQFEEIIELQFELKQMKETKKEDFEIVEQINTITLAVIDWLKIALSYEMANIQEQPVYKIRHIKCGVRLAEWCCHSKPFLQLLWDSNYNIHDTLLSLYEQEYMALSIKLLILKALDTYLTHKSAIERFIFSTATNSKENGFCAPKHSGYKILVEKIRRNPSVRLKFALSSIVRKLNLYEILQKLNMVLMKHRNGDFGSDDLSVMIRSLDQILAITLNGNFVFSQPKRFLPVSAQFEIVRSETQSVLVKFFKMFDLVQCFLLLLTHQSTMNLPRIKTPIFEILAQLLATWQGLEFVAENHQSMQLLLKRLLRTDEDLQYSLQDFIEIKSHNLGLEAAYKIEALYYVQNLAQFSDIEAIELIDQLHGLFCLTFTQMGRICVAEVLGMRDHFKSLLKFTHDIASKSEKTKKSPGFGYIIDLIHTTLTAASNITLLEMYFKAIFEIPEVFEDPINVKLVEIKSYLAPLDSVNLSSYDISHFIGVVVKQLDSVTSSPGGLITSLRVIQHLGISPHSNDPFSDFVELKYKHVILQLFSLDGCSILVKVLQKLCDFYEQPRLHSAIFGTSQGFAILNIIEPSLELLKQILTNVIHCRNTNFRDLTAIPVLLQTYNLLKAYPNSCGAYYKANALCNVILETLLVYTQPIADEIHEKDSLNKTLWTLMCGEVIKYVTTGPHTFIGGLMVLSELLPLPLPIQTIENLSKDESNWAINLRKLWSAHLHPHSAMIQELINKLCTTSHAQLLNLLRRVCVQLADLAANSAIMIARGVLDSVSKALSPDEGKVGVCNNHVTRLLNFLACLVTHGTIKSAVLHLIHGHNKSDEKYSCLVSLFSQVLKIHDSSTSHIQAQECILSIIQSFCDIEVTLLQSNAERSELNSDLYLANALPVREHLVSLIAMVLDYMQVDSSFVTYLPAVRTLLLLTEHDYGFFHLREGVVKKGALFAVILGSLARKFSKDSPECLSTLNTLVEFIRLCLTTEEVDESLLYTPRRMTMSLAEIKVMVGFGEGRSEEEKHPLFVLEDILKKLKDEEITFEGLLENVTCVLKSLQTETPENKDSFTEPLLPEPETLLTQFSGRLVFSSSEVFDERLTMRYWLSIPTDESENENIPCDLTEIVRQFLPADFSLTREIEKLCKICPSETTNEKESHENSQKTKTKKPFITPVRSRGFPRTIQQRSDLFRSRPPNTSRPPSLHVDDFVALETCGAQPTGPTGYNKFSRDLLASTRLSRGSRGRAFVASERSVQCRQMSWWGVNIARGPY